MSSLIKQSRVVWIDALKLVACFIIFWAHFLAVFCHGNLYESSTFFGRHILNSRVFQIVFDGSIWTIVFLWLSGLLLGMKSIKSFKQLLIAIFTRYIQFVIVIFTVSLFVLIISVSIGFPTQHYLSFLGNQRLDGIYTISFSVLDLLQSSFLFSNRMIPPLWMFKALFFSNILIMIVDWACHNLTEIEKSFILVFILFFSRFFFWINNLYLVQACIIGAVFSPLVSRHPTFLEKPESWRKIGSLPMCVYLVHVPIVYSISLYTFGFLFKLFDSNFSIAFLLTFALTNILVIFISIILERFNQIIIITNVNKLKKWLLTSNTFSLISNVFIDISLSFISFISLFFLISTATNSFFMTESFSQLLFAFLQIFVKHRFIAVLCVLILLTLKFFLHNNSIVEKQSLIISLFFGITILIIKVRPYWGTFKFYSFRFIFLFIVFLIGIYDIVNTIYQIIRKAT